MPGGAQIIQFGVTPGGHLGGQAVNYIGGTARVPLTSLVAERDAEIVAWTL